MAGAAGDAVYTDRVKSRVVVALVALAAVLLPGRMAPAEDPVAALSLIRSRKDWRSKLAEVEAGENP